MKENENLKKLEKIEILINSFTITAIKGILYADLALNSKANIIEQIIEDRKKLMILTNLKADLK